MLIRGGFRRVMILNGHRPNGTAVDVAARRVVDEHGGARPVEITALSYWEPSAAELHALRRSKVGGMGHACELETSFQLARRPHLVHMERLDGVHTPLVGWDLVAPVEPTRTYQGLAVGRGGRRRRLRGPPLGVGRVGGGVPRGDRGGPRTLGRGPGGGGGPLVWGAAAGDFIRLISPWRRCSRSASEASLRGFSQA
jgi:hypothetical protein